MNGFKPTDEEIRRLDRLARENERHLKFLRHSPREERWIPFVRDADADTDGDMLGAVVGVVACSVLLILAMLFSAT